MLGDLADVLINLYQSTTALQDNRTVIEAPGVSSSAVTDLLLGSISVVLLS
jgi:hypothetical protein